MVTVIWNDQLLDQIAAQLQNGIDRFNEQLANQAKMQLYPGHGYITGRLQQAIEYRAALRSGNDIVGTVGAWGVEYGEIVHARLHYLTIPLEHLLGNGAAIIVGGSR